MLPANAIMVAIKADHEGSELSIMLYNSQPVPNTRLVKNQILAANVIDFNLFCLKVLCITKCKCKKNYFIDRIIFSSASKCNLKDLDPDFVIE